MEIAKMIRLSNRFHYSTSQAKSSHSSNQGASVFSDEQIMGMAAPKRVNPLLWDLSSAQERRVLMESAAQEEPVEAGGTTETMSSGLEGDRSYNSVSVNQSKPRILDYTKYIQPKAQNGQSATQGEPTTTENAPSRKYSDAAQQLTNQSEQQALSDITQQFQQRFSAKAQDKSAFHDIMQKTFGNQYDQSKAETIRQQTLKGDFSWMPDIKLVDGQQLQDTSGTQTGGVGLGAYSKENDTIYLSRELLSTDKATAEKVLTEEVGHAIDTRVNVNDAKGDEGDIFSRFVHGEEVSTETLNALKQENDSGVIEIDGKKVEVEYGFFSKVKKAFKKVGRKIKKAVKKVGRGIKKVAKKIGKGIKKAVKKIGKGIKKLLQSKVFQGLLNVAQFIPGVGVFAKGINMVVSAYNVYQGVKNKSWGAVLGGVAGVAGGISKIGQSLGASSGFVNGAASVAKHAGNAATAYRAIAQKDFSAAAGLASNYFSGNSNVVDAIKHAGKAHQVYQSAKSGDYLNAIGAGSSLMQEFTGAAGDKVLQTIGQNAGTLQNVQNALKSGNYDTAAALLTEQYGSSVFGLNSEEGKKINQVANVFQNVHSANQLVKNHNYADAAQLLLKTARNHASSPESQQQLLKASQTVQQIDDAVNAVKQGQYSEGIAKAGELLGTPLDDQNRQVLTELQSFAEDARTLAKLVKSGAPREVIEEVKKQMKEQVVIYNLMGQAA
jgi:hypothetical protein